MQDRLDKRGLLNGGDKWLHSFLSYQLVEADLLVCMPALGDRIKVGFDEIDKTLRAYIIFQQHPRNPKIS